MLDAVLQSARVLCHINKDEGDESLPFLVFWRHCQCNLSEIFKGRLSSSHVGIRNIPSDVCYDVTKHYQVQSEHRCTQNPLKHLRWTIFAQTVNTLKPLFGYAKKSILGVWRGSEYASAAKQGRCKVCKKNSRRCYVKCKSMWYVFWNISMIFANVWSRNVGFKNVLIRSVFNNIFVQLFWSLTGSFFLIFPSRLSVTFDIQFDLKIKHA